MVQPRSKRALDNLALLKLRAKILSAEKEVSNIIYSNASQPNVQSVFKMHDKLDSASDDLRAAYEQLAILRKDIKDWLQEQEN